MTLCNISKSIVKGSPFRRDAFPQKLHYYYDTKLGWFIQVNSESGTELIMFTLDLKLEDLIATDWEIMNDN